MKSSTLSKVVHFLAFACSNGVILAFVPAEYKELATVVANFVIGVSAFYDHTHGDEIAGRA